VRIFITGQGKYASAIPLKTGEYYDAEPAMTGTDAQNRAFHALLQEYWSSGMHSYPSKSFEEFRDCIKRDLGAGFSEYVYITRNGKRAKSKELPVDYMVYEGEKFLFGKLKSWADYTKKERRETIDRLLSSMYQAGINSRKFEEIVKGMQGVFDNQEKSGYTSSS
jgi:hypothetical protein